VLKYDESPAKREQALKRLYVNDTGLVTACRFLTPADRGFLLETAVFLELAKRELPCCYDANHAECDLVVSEGERVVRAIQVCDTLTADNRTRELRGLRQTMKRFGLREGAIVSRTQEEMLAVDGGMVHVVPAWKWACTQADL
jgi:predicted AAA+ superfamily ATPase